VPGLTSHPLGRTGDVLIRISVLTAIENPESRFYSTQECHKIQKISVELVIDPTNYCVSHRYDPTDAAGIVGI